MNLYDTLTLLTLLALLTLHWVFSQSAEALESKLRFAAAVSLSRTICPTARLTTHLHTDVSLENPENFQLDSLTTKSWSPMLLQHRCETQRSGCQFMFLFCCKGDGKSIEKDYSDYSMSLQMNEIWIKLLVVFSEVNHVWHGPLTTHARCSVHQMRSCGFPARHQSHVASHFFPVSTQLQSFRRRVHPAKLNH